MKHFDRFFDGTFKTQEDGTTLFYPNGVWGKGYIISDAKRVEELRVSVRRTSFWSYIITYIPAYVLILAIFNSPWPWQIFFVILLVVLLASLIFVWDRITKTWTNGLTIAKSRISLLESYQISAQTLSWLSLWMAEGMGWVTLWLGFWFLQQLGFANVYVQLACWLISLIGVCVIVLYGYMIWFKATHRAN